jgi:uncharacterized protein YdcH (DUF465 family)
MNILYGTTLGWNPGDELILKGIRNLINIDHNAIYYNRHPYVNRESNPQSYRFDLGTEYIDHVVFAGTPEWNRECLDMYRAIAEYDIPFSFLGVGGHTCAQEQVYNASGLGTYVPGLLNERVYGKAKAKIARDRWAKLAIHDSTLVCCPSFFANDCLDLEPRRKLRKVAVSWQDGSVSVCGVRNPLLVEAVTKFAKEHDLPAICHSYDDFVSASHRGLKAIYSSHFEDFFDVYKEFDLIVGFRIHAGGFASTLGIPSLIIPHDERANAVRHFGSVVCKHQDLGDTFDQIDNNWIQEQSEKIMELKKEKYNQFVKLIPHLRKRGSKEKEK